MNHLRPTNPRQNVRAILGQPVYELHSILSDQYLFNC